MHLDFYRTYFVFFVSARILAPLDTSFHYFQGLGSVRDEMRAFTLFDVILTEPNYFAQDSFLSGAYIILYSGFSAPKISLEACSLRFAADALSICSCLSSGCLRLLSGVRCPGHRLHPSMTSSNSIAGLPGAGFLCA